MVIITTKEATVEQTAAHCILKLTYFKTFVGGEYIGYGWAEDDAIQFGERYAKDM